MPEKPRIVTVDRPLEESIESMRRRFALYPDRQHLFDSGQIATLLAAQAADRTRFLRDNPSIPVHHVSYSTLRRSPRETVESLADFLGLSPFEEQLHHAVSYIE